ncbi:MAG: class I tRNA ligase family protein [Patescibacteria group bacterium]
MKTPNERELAILKFWQDNNIFQKSLDKNPSKEQGGKSFRYYDGPPYATGLPHMGNLLPTAVKDAFPRYKTMQGFNVPRTWGWDCHGLPIESLVEKKLGFKGKKDIEEYGVDKFNETARASVFEFRENWKTIIPRLGRWVDMDHDYRTLDATFMESGLWAFKQLWDKNLVYEGYKVMPWCPHCGTVLSNYEVTEGYKEITDLSAYARFPLTTEPTTSFVAWTTTPWTLPGNVVLAVGNDIAYVYVKIEPTNETIIVSKTSLDKVKLLGGDANTYTIVKEVTGKDLVGLTYTPPFNYYTTDATLENEQNAWKVYVGDFVTDTDGTGIVHIAPAFGADDMKLAQANNLPVIKHVLPNGNFAPEVKDFSGQAKPIEDHQKSDIEVIKYLAHAGKLFAKEKYTHTYPHCWRCKTPLLNYATTSWFIKTTSLKDRMIEENKKINWYPEEIGTKRLNMWLENVRDWAVSRSRFWGTPLPIWKGEKTGKTVCVGSLEEIRSYTRRNTYMAMRHGQATHLVERVMSSHQEFAEKHGITDLGKSQILESVELMIAENTLPTVIYHSPLRRTRETAEIVRDAIEEKTGKKIPLVSDARMREEDFGDLDGHGCEEHDSYRTTPEEYINKRFPNGESYADMRMRMGDFLYAVDAERKDERILLVTHEGCVYGAEDIASGMSLENIIATHAHIVQMHPGQYRTLNFAAIPHNATYEADFHRPYVDEVVFDIDGEKYTRLPEVLDVWYDAGSMPFASVHYPFNKEVDISKTITADMVAEGLDQTRGWFYHMLIMSVALFDKKPFDNVMVNGLLLAEDGRKMSKSLNNFPELMPIVEKYGADTVRYFLLSSPIVHADEVAFSEKALTEIQNKLFNKLTNVMSFLDMYGIKDKGLDRMHTTEHILDAWIQVELDALIKDMTESLDGYQIDKALRPLLQFVENLSTWYLRRSRDRFKDEEDGLIVTNKLITVLGTLSKLMAPATPFMAEEIYQFVKNFDSQFTHRKYKESVHLESWPVVSSTLSNPEKEEIVTKMQKTREVVEQVLGIRNKNNIKVRQPLGSLTLPIATFSNVHIHILQDELNIKRIGSSLEGEIVLDTTVTEDLRIEGLARDIIREIQSKRKDLNLMPTDKVSVVLEIEDGLKGDYEAVLAEHKKTVTDAVNAATCEIVSAPTFSIVVAKI